MTKNPIINGLAAELYIVLIVAVLNWGTRLAIGKDDTFLAPLAMISLFTLSAAVMGYIFGLQPIQLYLDGKKKQAVALFLVALQQPQRPSPLPVRCPDSMILDNVQITR